MSLVIHSLIHTFFIYLSVISRSVLEDFCVNLINNKRLQLIFFIPSIISFTTPLPRSKWLQCQLSFFLFSPSRVVVAVVTRLDESQQY